MTKIQETLVALPEEKKALFIPAFGDVDKFYTTVYLIARNEHVADIASDYFEDYVNYKEPDIRMTNEEFLGIIQKVARE